MSRSEERTSDSPRPVGTRDIARRNAEEAGIPLSAVLKTAATACELAEARRRHAS